MALRTIKLTPKQTREVYELVLERKNLIQELLDTMGTSKEISEDFKHVKENEIMLKQILSQLEKKL